MDNSNSPTDRIHRWFESSPKAQRAYQRLSADLDAVVEWIESATSGLRERVSPIIDPVREPAPEPAPEPPSEPGLMAAERGDAERISGPLIPESESSVPPGVKRDTEPIDPTS
jgi:hypothetical protein